MTLIHIEDFLNLPGTLLDVRSPGEFAHGHLPGAINLPLFTNEERAVVGTAYKQQGQKVAISLGLKITGPKLADFVDTASALTNTTKNQAKIYCWRGGMRSGAMSWLLDFAGIQTSTLKGGYKTFRRWIHEQFERKYQFTVVGGMTGSGKTAFLDELKEQGQQVLNLEAIANHRGSSYGRLGISTPQPSTEHFENEIGMILAKMDPLRTIWIEDESRLIGTCHIPECLIQQMNDSPMVVLDIPKEKRMDRLMNEYGSHPIEGLVAATEKIGKHLGGQRKKEALQALKEGNIQKALEIILEYYDATYTYALSKRKNSFTILDTKH